MKTHCPTHRDTHPSLSVSAKNGVTQVHCFAGCAQSATWDEVKRQVLGRRPGLYGDGNLVRLHTRSSHSLRILQTEVRAAMSPVR